MKKQSSKEINAWCSYDMANSGYSLVIATVLYPVFFETSSRQAFGSSIVNFLGLSIKNTVLYEYSTAVAYLLGIIISLSFAGLGDLFGYKKRFWKFFTLVGSLSCIALYWYNGENVLWGTLMPAIAIISFVVSFVFYNSFLPEIVPENNMNEISGRGYAFGYAGSMVLLVFVLFQINNYTLFGFINKTQAVRFAFIEVGIWWFLVSQYSFYHLTELDKKVSFNKSAFFHGFRQLSNVYKTVKYSQFQYGYLIIFFLFSVGVQTIMIITALIVSVELNLDQTGLIIGIIIVQLTGIVGAFLISKISNYVNDKVTLIAMLVVWLLICLIGSSIKTGSHFYILAAAAGLVMAGIQSQSRAIWARFIPNKEGSTASYFSFYDSVERMALVVGMFFFGFIDKLTHNLRFALLSLSFFFIMSIVLLIRLPFKK